MATGSYFQSGGLRDSGDVSRTVQYTFKDLSLIGDTEIIPAQGAGIKIRLLAISIHAGAGVSVRLKSGGNNMSGSIALSASSQFVLPLNVHGWMQTNANEALNLNQSIAISSSIQVVWIQTT